MRSLTGAMLLIAGEQAFAHSFLIGFPHQVYAQTILLPFAAVSVLTGLACLATGFFRDQKPS